MSHAEHTNNPLVSIVMPAYNREKTIGAALESIIRQTYSKWEAIVVDDGSSDNTQSIVEAASSADSRIRYVAMEKNSGAQAARNRGIREAKGEWIAFLDSDDQYLDHSLEARMKAAHKSSATVFYTPGFIVHQDGRKRPYELPRWSGDIYKDVLQKEGPMFQSLMARKEIFEGINYLDESVRSYQEWDTAIRLAEKNEFECIPEKTFIYDYRSPDAISRSGHGNGRGYEQVVNKHYWPILKNLGSSGMAIHYDKAAKWYAEGGSKFNSLRCRFLSQLWKLLSFKVMKNRIKKIIHTENKELNVQG